MFGCSFHTLSLPLRTQRNNHEIPMQLIGFSNDELELLELGVSHYNDEGDR